MDGTCAIHKRHGIDRDYFPAGEDLLYYGQGLIVCPASKDWDYDAAIADIEIRVTERQASSCKGPFWKNNRIRHGQLYDFNPLSLRGSGLIQKFIVVLQCLIIMFFFCVSFKGTDYPVLSYKSGNVINMPVSIITFNPILKPDYGISPKRLSQIIFNMPFC